MGFTLVPVTNAPSPGSGGNGWSSIACSADGTKLVISGYFGGIYTSTNSGATWISNAAPVNHWHSLACSADGTRMAATTWEGNGQVWTNSGTTWYPTASPTASIASYENIACSTDGTKLVTAAAISPYHYVFTSPDSGTTWNQANVPNNLSYYAVASSADGTKLAVFVENANVMYTSPDSGTTWVSNAIPTFNWIAASSSADGSKLVAVAFDGGSYRSADSGTTWVSNNVSGASWYTVASSSDGNSIIALEGGPYYTTTNFGQNWISNSSPALVLEVAACSTNATKGYMAGFTGTFTSPIPILYSFAPVVTPPQLSLLSSNSQYAIAWPSSVTGFQLQQNTNLSAANWSNVTSPVVLSNGMNEVLVSPTNASTFYRLISQ
ncbi:MAG TPA: hypothetical protein VKV04_24970 [Verrucomicrobiae bacterium]|nr:hypothetical protein [Verrucomicrobiae bacterium]